MYGVRRIFVENLILFNLRRSKFLVFHGRCYITLIKQDYCRVSLPGEFSHLDKYGGLCDFDVMDDDMIGQVKSIAVECFCRNMAAELL